MGNGFRLGLTLSLLFLLSARAEAAPEPSPPEYCSKLRSLEREQRLSQYNCGIILGSKTDKKIALIFTGGSYAEGYSEIKGALDDVGGKASFFFTGDFLRTPEFRPLVQQLRRDGHYIGPHSDRHVEPVDEDEKTRISHKMFRADLRANLTELNKYGVTSNEVKYWIVPGEAYNEEISRWSYEEKIKLINYSEGTRSNADYTGDDDDNYVNNDRIEKSILDYAKKPQGLNGFLLLLHLGVGPERSHPFHQRIRGLLHKLSGQGYSFVRVDELLDPSFQAPSRAAAEHDEGSLRGR